MINKKRILHLITGLEIGGAEMMLLKVLPGLGDDFENWACCIRGRGPVGKKMEDLGIHVEYLDLKNVFDISIISKFKKIIDEFQPDILVTYLIHADLFGRILGRIFGIKKIVCSVRVKLTGIKYLPLLLVDGLTSFLVDNYHFNSKTVAELYSRYLLVPSRKIHIIPNGIDVSKFENSIDKQFVRKLLGLTQSYPLILCVGRLENQKGQKYLIKAIKELIIRKQLVYLALAGDGGNREKLEKYARGLGISEYIFFLGRRSDVPVLLRTADVFVLPSLYEGMSNAIMEAMAAGVPVVATRIKENEELITEDETGTLVAKRNSSEISTAIATILDHAELHISKASVAQEIIQERYSISGITEQFKKYFNSI